MNTVFIVGILQGVFVLVLLLSKKEKAATEKVLIIWLLMIVSHLGYGYLTRNEIFSATWASVLNGLIPFLQGPMLYLYFTSIYVARVDRIKTGLHFIPVLLLLTFQLSGIHAQWLVSVFYTYLMLSVPLYILWVLRCSYIISRLRKKTHYSIAGWLKWPLIGLGAVWATFLVFEFLIAQNLIDLSPYFFISITLFVYLLAFHIYKNGALVRQLQGEGPQEDASTIEKAMKYSKSGLSAEKAAECHRQLLVYMSAQKPYLDSELSLALLASKLEMRTNHLSQVINELEQKSFGEFINAYRVKEFINLNDTEGSILSKAFQCGFKSKASFNRVFKKEIGQSPSDYFRKH